MKKLIVAAAGISLCMALPATADPTLGIGVSFSFGSGSGETGLGVRAFSDNDSKKVVASVGVDYMITSNRFRPTIGAAYLGTNNYIGGDVGFGLQGEGVNFGLGLGGVDTK